MAAARIGLFTSGLWAHRAEIAAMTGLTPVRRRWSARGLAAVAGWGRKPPALRARAAAARAGAPFWTLEDGFLRSVAPGPAEAPASYVLDRQGIYFDADAPSDLEALIRARAADPAGAEAAAAPALHALQALGLSKYNRFDADPAGFAPLHPDPARNVLLVDQTRGDASVAGAGAGPETFAAMLAHAARTHPEAVLLLKTHPETLTGRRAGHFDPAARAAAAAADPALAEAEAQGRVRPLTARLRPRDLFARVAQVHVVSSLLGFEALAAGLPVTCHGRAFYSGWGLTTDLGPPTGRRGPAPLAALVAAAFTDYCRWFDPETRAPTDLAGAAERISARLSACPTA